MKNENEVMTFRERMRRKSAAQRQVEAITEPAQWRFVKAQYGWCRTCRKSFEIGERILWNVPTKLAFHPECAARVHPDLPEWIYVASRSRWPL